VSGFKFLKAALTSEKPLWGIGDVALNEFIHRIFYAYVRTLEVSYAAISVMSLKIDGVPNWSQNLINSILTFTRKILNGKNPVQKMLRGALARTLMKKANEGISQLSTQFEPLPVEVLKGVKN
jgi:signal transduction histidine kinase